MKFGNSALLPMMRRQKLRRSKNYKLERIMMTGYLKNQLANANTKTHPNRIRSRSKQRIRMLFWFSVHVTDNVGPTSIC